MQLVKLSTQHSIYHLAVLHVLLSSHMFVSKNKMAAYPASGRCDGRDHIDAPSRPKIPKANCFILGTTYKHGASPVV